MIQQDEIYIYNNICISSPLTRHIALTGLLHRFWSKGFLFYKNYYRQSPHYATYRRRYKSVCQVADGSYPSQNPVEGRVGRRLRRTNFLCRYVSTLDWGARRDRAIPHCFWEQFDGLRERDIDGHEKSDCWGVRRGLRSLARGLIWFECLSKEKREPLCGSCGFTSFFFPLLPVTSTCTNT